jgi:SPX domain protein involved in polyphosphate accumulation
MKFGETFAQRSVPEWGAFNLNYNAIKDVIKRHTSNNLNHGGPVNIPQQGKSRWEDSDQALFEIFNNQYDNISLFLGMKRGEIDRRLNALKRQISSLRAYADERALEGDVVASMHGRKYRKLSKEMEELGDLVQKVARFASAQKIAFRKLLKKYTKWTGSTSLQTRMDVELFSSSQLRTDYSDYLQELAELRTLLTEELAVPVLRRQQVERLARQQQQDGISTTSTRSLISQINDSIKAAPSAFDAAIMTVPYGEAAGSAMYWIHPDNLDEARALLHRNMKRVGPSSSSPSRAASQESLLSANGVSASLLTHPSTHMVVFDNAQRFVADKSSARPSKIALSAHWTCNRSAAVTLAGLAPSSSGERTVLLDLEDLPIALNRESNLKKESKAAAAVHQYLIEHRDVKPLAQIQANRTRYVGVTNTADVATWATLDTSIMVGAVDTQQLGNLQRSCQGGEAFPYTVLHIRWEFARMPAVVRAFDESHLAYRVHDFAIEDMAIRKVQKDLPRPSWQHLLGFDITKLPLPHAPSFNRLKTTSRMRTNASDISGTSSGPSSSEGPTDSVFSTGTHGNSSVTSEETRGLTLSSPEGSRNPSDQKAPKKRARIVVPEREPRFRYWNEFDDGDSDVNPQDSYAIYVDPNEPTFPALSEAWEHVKSSWPLKLITAHKASPDERTPLLYEEDVASIESSDSDSFVEAQQQQLRQGLVWGLVGGVGISFLIALAVLAFCIFSLT